MSGPAKGTFRSLANFNYRIRAGGAIVSNVGTWMQRTAQDWLVLTQLTHNNATAMGVVMALQFAPQILFLPWTGFAADHLDRRKLLLATQGGMGLLALMEPSVRVSPCRPPTQSRRRDGFPPGTRSRL
jgi:MFS family permease